MFSKKSNCVGPHAVKMILNGPTSTGQIGTRETYRFERINDNTVMPAIISKPQALDQ